MATDSSIICPKCKTPNVATAVFCANCGTRLGLDRDSGETVASEARSPSLQALDNRIRSGTNWFYWIAGLSIVNTVSYLAGSTYTFVVGLGATQVVDGFMAGAAESLPDAGTALRAVGVVIDLIIAGLFALFGYLGGKRYRWAIVTGLILYVLDGILLLLFGEFLGAAFHLWALISIWAALRALAQLRALDKPSTQSAIESAA